MYNEYSGYNSNQLHNIKINDSKLEECQINNSHLFSPQIQSGIITGTAVTCCNISHCMVDDVIDSQTYDLGAILNNIMSELNKLKQQNDFLLKLLVSKGILEDESELSELIESNKVIEKLKEDI